MFGFFKAVLYLGVVMGLAGFAMPYLNDVPAIAALPPMTKSVLSWGGLGLILIGLVARTVTRRSDGGF